MKPVVWESSFMDCSPLFTHSWGHTIKNWGFLWLIYKLGNYRDFCKFHLFYYYYLRTTIYVLLKMCYTNWSCPKTIISIRSSSNTQSCGIYHIKPAIHWIWNSVSTSQTMLHLRCKYQLIKLVYSDNNMEHTRTMCGNIGFISCVTIKGPGTYMYTLNYTALFTQELHNSSLSSTRTESLLSIIK